jgi:molybdopterin synthase sulfur carrier subunit
MANVFIPATMRSLTGGREVVEASGRDVRGVIDDLEQRYPGIRDRLCEDGELRTGLSVVVGASVSGLGLRQHVEADDEIHFLPAIGGGHGGDNGGRVT